MGLAAKLQAAEQQQQQYSGATLCVVPKKVSLPLQDAQSQLGLQSVSCSLLRQISATFDDKYSERPGKLSVSLRL